MSSAVSSAFRRIVLLTLISALAGAAVKSLRDRRGAVAPAAAEWPPFEPTIVPPSATISPDAADTEQAWVGPTTDGVAPEGFAVKVKTSSGIFHVPGGRFHERTIADRHYASAAAAEADGYRPSKS